MPSNKCSLCGKFVTRIGVCMYCANKANKKLSKDFNKRRQPMQKKEQILLEKIATFVYKGEIEVYGENRQHIYYKGNWSQQDQEYNLHPIPYFTSNVKACFDIVANLDSVSRINFTYLGKLISCTIYFSNGTHFSGLAEYSEGEAYAFCDALIKYIEQGGN